MYETHLCNGCHDLMQKAMNFNDVAIASIKGSDYRIHLWHMSKDVMKNSDLKKNSVIIIFFSFYIKMSETTYYKRNREIVLNRAKYFYKNNNEKLREKARKRYRELSEEEKSINIEYGRNRYHNMTEQKKY